MKFKLDLTWILIVAVSVGGIAWSSVTKDNTSIMAVSAVTLVTVLIKIKQQQIEDMFIKQQAAHQQTTVAQNQVAQITTAAVAVNDQKIIALEKSVNEAAVREMQLLQETLKITKERVELETKYISLQGDYSRLKLNFDSLADRFALSEKQDKEKAIIIDDLRKRLDTLNASLERKNAREETYQTQIDSANQRYQAVVVERDVTVAAMAAQQIEIADLKRQITEQQGEINRLNDQYAKLNNILTQKGK